MLAGRLCGVLPAVLESAEEMVNRALSIRREKQGPHHLQVGYCLLKVAELHWSRATYREVRARLARAGHTPLATPHWPHPLATPLSSTLSDSPRSLIPPPHP
jgi:hypothetical protein